MTTKRTKTMIEAWIKERDEAVLSLDVQRFKEFYEKWRKQGFYSFELPADEVIEVSLRKTIGVMTEATPEQKEEAKQWLFERGLEAWE